MASDTCKKEEFMLFAAIMLKNVPKLIFCTCIVTDSRLYSSQTESDSTRSAATFLAYNQQYQAELTKFDMPNKEHAGILKLQFPESTSDQIFALYARLEGITCKEILDPSSTDKKMEIIIRNPDFGVAFFKAGLPQTFDCYKTYLLER